MEDSLVLIIFAFIIGFLMPNIMSNICSLRLIEAAQGGVEVICTSNDPSSCTTYTQPSNNDSIINKDIENLINPYIEQVKTINKDSIINNDIENLVRENLDDAATTGRKIAGYAHQVGDQVSGYEDRVGDQFARYGQQTAKFWNDLL
jgi:hypothetical protein